MSTPLEQWVESVAKMTRPSQIQWCDGSEEEDARIKDQLVREGQTFPLNEKTYPGSILHRSDPSDVARTEKVTYICSEDREEAGPTNNWMAPAEAKKHMSSLFEGSMKGRTMYVVPYIMGPAASPQSRIGVELTDSAYVVASMRIMSRMGKVALDRLGNSSDFVPGLHSLGDLSPDRRLIAHFPEEKLIWSIGSGYGGNALLGKKCFALRIASSMAREQGWMAEHMLILGLESPDGKVTYMAAAFPSACGKTNLCMMVSALENEGYRVWTVGDDISWMQVGADGYLHAINPEAGFFGVAPGTNDKTNPNVMSALRENTIFTNVAMTPQREPWWEGMSDQVPSDMLDWQGRPWNPANGPAAQANSRYTVPAAQAPCISPRWEDPAGVPISAFIFGGRRARLAPLVYEAKDWQHGVYIASTMASETTAAITGAVGVTRRDPMAMLPFCGYNMADYFGHWLEMGRNIPHPPKIFHVNWFRKGADGKFLWPGYGENARVLKWMLERIEGKGAATETPIGAVPTTNAITLDGINVSKETMNDLLRVDPADWVKEHADTGNFFEKFGDRLPEEISEEHSRLGERLQRTAVAQK
ncbi:MAG TPA: phosphoenolpyruvate carboxykinase (GTP) [Candidatus Saccharimonadales bacterium]|nr:phosphoenolpyruvate carboxykinase (GTP) [Candidatus Saccharimonadales bacterium]